MNEITAAITARHAQIKTLQADIDALQRAASVLGGQTTAKVAHQPKTKRKRRKRRTVARVTSQPKAPAKPKAKPQSKPKPTPKAKKRHQWSAAEKGTIGKRMKAKG